MATEAAKNAIKAAMSFKNTPAPNCRSGGIKGLRTSKGSGKANTALKDWMDKVKQAKKDIPEEELK